ncbi:hypothetical protein LguiA_019950 [Lonicera macranthoides]
MDIRSWCNSGTRTFQSGRFYEELAPATTQATTRPGRPAWKLLWKKFKKEKKKMFESSVHGQVPYDEYTYSQNFDHGPSWDEPENLSRSFSARFADPSMIFVKKER